MDDKAVKWLNDNEDKWKYDANKDEYKLLVEEAPKEVIEYLERKNQVLNFLRGFKGDNEK